MANTYLYIGNSSENISSEITYYQQLFTVSSWGGPVSGYYFLTIPQSTHGKTGNVSVVVYENISGNFEEVDTFVQVNSSLDVTLRIDATTNNSFAGKILIL